MSRSNYDKPFYVDIGTSIVAIRCASNRDVIVEYDYEKCPQVIKFTEDICDRMNKEVEIGKPLRNCDVGTYVEQADRFNKFCEKQGRECAIGHKGNCPIFKGYKVDCGIVWEQLPYEEEGEE